MLILSRKTDEEIRIGEDVVLKVIEIRGGKARLAFTAPPHVRIHREEVFQAIQTERAEAPERLPAA